MLLGRRHKLKKSGKVSLSKLNRHPSAGCKQRLSTAELIEITQQDRVARKQRKLKGGS